MQVKVRGNTVQGDNPKSKKEKKEKAPKASILDAKALKAKRKEDAARAREEKRNARIARYTKENPAEAEEWPVEQQSENAAVQGAPGAPAEVTEDAKIVGGDAGVPGDGESTVSGLLEPTAGVPAEGEVPSESLSSLRGEGQDAVVLSDAGVPPETPKSEVQEVGQGIPKRGLNLKPKAGAKEKSKAPVKAKQKSGKRKVDVDELEAEDEEETEEEKFKRSFTPKRPKPKKQRGPKFRQMTDPEDYDGRGPVSTKGTTDDDDPDFDVIDEAAKDSLIPFAALSIVGTVACLALGVFLSSAIQGILF